MSRNDQLVLVTGASGFVGSHLTEALLARGYRVRCMVRRSSDLRFIGRLPVEWSYADLEDAPGVARACRGVDMVCHCAALTRALREETFLRVNTQATVQLANLAIETNPALERFMYVSSLTATGPSAHADDYLDEESPPAPITWYGQSKLAAEDGLRWLSDHMPLTIVRPAIVFGPRDRDLRVYFSMIKRGLALELGRRRRALPFIYIKDLVELLILALESPRALGQTYFGIGETASYAEISRAVARTMGKRPLTIKLPESVLGPMSVWARMQGRLTGKPALLNEQRIRDMRRLYWLYSGEKAKRDLGFVAQVGLEAGLKETADWYEQAGWI